MSTDPLDRYQSMMHDTHAPAHLPDQVLEQARARLAADKAESTAAASCGTRTANATCTPQPSAPTPAREAPATPVFSVKRSRMKGFALAACTVLALGLGGTAIALGLPGLVGNDDVPAVANSFQLAAFADEGGTPANGPVTLNSQDFMLMRASTGPLYDAETDSYPGPIVASRAYNLNLTCSGENIASITYELQGEGVSFNNWQLTSEYLESNGEPEVGSAVATADQDSTFTVDYHDQDMSAIDRVHHEICLSYVLEGSDRQAWDELQASTAQPRIPRDNMTEEEIAAWNEASDKFELVLGQHDAEIISQAKIAITATFNDGTTATKTYRLVPVDDFEQAYSAYLADRFSADGAAEPNRPVLYTLEEVTG